MANIEITTNLFCPNNCLFCPTNKLKEAYTGEKVLTLEKFKLILDKIPIENSYIHFSAFSEPFVNPESSLMMKEAYSRGYGVVLFTTLIGLREEDLLNLKDVRFGNCVIHAPDDKCFKTNETLWIKNFKMFSSQININNVYYYLGEVSDEVKNIANPVKMNVITRSNLIDKSIVQHIPRKSKIKYCHNFRQPVILPNGDAFLCCNDWSLKHKLGNLLVDSFEDLFNSLEMKNIEAAINNPNIELICRYCERA